MRWSACGARTVRPARRPLRPSTLLAVGRLKAGPEAALFVQYNTRLRPPLAVVEIPEARGSAGEVRKREGEALLRALPEGALLVALDLGGSAPTSEAFAALLQRWQESGRVLCFVIGGAEGLDAAVQARAEHRLSLSAMTWPHFLVRGMLAEQLYRAQAIATGHPYHRAWRP